MNQQDSKDDLTTKLALKAINLAGARSNEIDRYCWMIVHEYRHGVLPVEYDIRDIDEHLYLTVLKKARNHL